VETSERSTDGQTGETRLCDGRVDNPLLAEAVEQALCDLVTVVAQSAPPLIRYLLCMPCDMLLPQLYPPLSYRRHVTSVLFVVVVVGTYAPLYCATSSPRTKTFSFRSISSAIASLSASRTVISFWPDAYPLLAIDGVMAAARKAGRKAGAGREAETRREAGRRSLEAAIVGDV
jgi:hypothetical protein